MHPANPRLHERLTLSGAVVHGGGKGGGGSTTTVQQADPWQGQQQYLRDVFGLAQDQFDRGTTIVPFSQDTLRAQQMQRELIPGSQANLEMSNAANRNMMMGQGTDPYSRQLQAEASGAFLNANPYLDQMYNQAADQVTNRFHSAFGTSGRFGSPSHQRELAGGLADMATNIYGANYSQERDRQQLAARTGLSGVNQAIGRAPSLDQARFIPAQILGGVGAQTEGLQQAIANQPANDLARYAALVQGGYGGTTTTRGPGGSGVNPAAGLLGGAATGAGIAGALGGPAAIGGPWTAGLVGAGALLGLL